MRIRFFHDTIVSMLSIIIPTLNEEEYLPKLLRSIKRQGIRDMEIIVADAGSKDATVKVAKSYGCKVVRGGMPARGRNEGAEEAKGELFLFLDADVILPPKFLRRFLSEFEKRRLDIAGCASRYTSRKKMYIALENFWNLYAKSTQKFYPCAAQCILVKKSLHDKVGGFDETIKLGEDFVYVRKAKKFGKFAFLSHPFYFMSPRRFEEGMVKTSLQLVLAEPHMLFLGPIRSDIFKYRFRHLPKRKKQKKSA